MRFPERFAQQQQALGHNRKAVHRAYSKHAEVTVPSLDDLEAVSTAFEGRQGGFIHASPIADFSVGGLSVGAGAFAWAERSGG